MRLEDKYQDLLQNIEFAIVTVYRDDPSVKDLDVLKGLGGLIQHYQRLAAGRATSAPELEGAPLDIFNAVNSILEFRKELLKGEGEQPARRSFSRALREPSEEEILVACLRKIEKSAKGWNKRNGERGYLDFVIDFLP